MSANNPATAVRTVMAIKPQSSSAAVTGTGFDRRGWRNAKVSLLLGTMTATGTSDVKVQESDTLGGTYADITGAVFAQKVAATDGDKVYVGEIDLRGRKRYLRVVATQATAASLVAVQVDLYNPDRSDRVWVAQEGSASAAAPLAETGAGAFEFSV